jgi:acyl-CoA synthetase (AMP-forming)/AMP-acid ligase II
MDNRLPEVPYRPTLPALLHRAVDRYGDDDFLVVGRHRLSFRDAERKSRQVALQLISRGVGKGARIGIILPTGIEWVITWLAAARVGAMSMLLPATYRPAELRRALKLGDVAVLFAPSEMLGKDYESFLELAVPTLAGHDQSPLYDPDVPSLRSICMFGGSGRSWAVEVPSEVARPTAELLTAVEDDVSPADPLLVIFTSGSSAEPKAVVHTHGSAIRKIQPELGMCLPGSFPGRTFCAMPLFWVGGPQELLGALHSGATVVTQPRFEPTEALDLLEAEQCNSIMGWASILDQLKADPTYPGRQLADLSMPAIATSSKGHPRNLGMTETFGPHANPAWFDYKVIDPDSGAPLPDGEEGEFCVRGFGLMAGLYKKEREESFDREGWYHTGDRGYIENGTIWFTGRYSEMIKSGGSNVSPLEVETVLLAIPSVSQAFVVGVDDEERGQVVAAAVVPVKGTDPDPAELRRLVNSELSSYKVPAKWRLLSPADVPYLPSGKPDKRSLKELF